MFTSFHNKGQNFGKVVDITEAIKMNMRTPKHLVDKDPMFAGVPLIDVSLSEFTDNGWTDEEFEDFEREVEQQLLEEEFIAACFEEMWAEEDAEWEFYLESFTQSFTGNPYLPLLYSEPILQAESRTTQVVCSKLNPEAPEFVPRGTAS